MGMSSPVHVGAAPWPSVLSAIVLLMWATTLALLLAWLCWTHRRFMLSMFQDSRHVNCKQLRSCLFQLGMCAGVSDVSLRFRIEAIADRQRIERVESLLRFLVCGVPLLILHHVLTAYELASENDFEYLLHRERSFFFYVPIEALAVLFFIKPATLTKSSLRLAFALTMARRLYMAIAVHADTDVDDFALLRAEFEYFFDHTLRLWLGLVLQDAPFIVISHLVQVPLVLAVNIAHVHDNVVLVCAMEVMLAGIVCIASISMERATKTGIHASLLAESSRAMEGAAGSLLSSLCDAVVYLAPSFEVIEDCPRLSTMLHMDPSIPLQVNFCDLLQGSHDKQAFTKFMQAEEAIGDALARTMHVTLLDANKLPVLVQLFHTAFCGMNEAEVHIVGVRDTGGERHPPSASDSDYSYSKESHPSSPASRELGQKPLAPIGEDLAWESDGESLSASGSPPEHAGGCAEDEEMKLWILVLDHSLPVVAWTPAFQNLVGQAGLRIGADFMHLMVSTTEREKLMGKLKHLTSHLMNEEAGHTSDIQFAMAAKHHMLQRVDVEAQVHLDFSLEQEEEDEDDFLVAIHVRSWRKTRARSRSGGTFPRSSIRRMLPNVSPPLVGPNGAAASTNLEPGLPKDEGFRPVVSL